MLEEQSGRLYDLKDWDLSNKNFWVIFKIKNVKILKTILLTIYEYYVIGQLCMPSDISCVVGSVYYWDTEAVIWGLMS